jgi:hypothetical protein
MKGNKQSLSPPQESFGLTPSQEEGEFFYSFFAEEKYFQMK